MKTTDSMLLAQLAEQHKLKIRRDECGDKIIPGKRGHLYFAGGELCLMVTDGKYAKPSRWAALSGKLWIGDKSQGLQDVWIKGIPPENAAAAVRMCRIRVKVQLSEEEHARRAERMRGLRLKAA
jgi:hypothetical protein